MRGFLRLASEETAEEAEVTEPAEQSSVHMSLLARLVALPEVAAGEMGAREVTNAVGVLLLISSQTERRHDGDAITH